MSAEIDKVADAIARHRGAGPLHLMPESAQGQYRAMARAAMVATVELLEARLDTFPQGGRHTRARWTTTYVRMLADKPGRVVRGD